jgi:nucleoside-diphosphate-sugar epimerase
VLAELGRIAGRAPVVTHGAAQPGDPRDTGADIARARADLAWSPAVPLADGLARQVAWQKEGA